MKNLYLFQTALCWPDKKASFHKFISDPDLDPYSNPDPDTERLFRVRIRIRV